jgi:hypothetical protein
MKKFVIAFVSISLLVRFAAVSFAANTFRRSIMKFGGSLGCTVFLLFFAWSLAEASVVTLVNGELITQLEENVEKGKQPIILTFGDDRLVVHDSSLPVEGNRVTSEDIPLNKLFLVTDRRAASKRLGYESLYSYRGFHLARVERPDELAGIHLLKIKPVTESHVLIEKVKPTRMSRESRIDKVIAKLNESRYERIFTNVVEKTPSRYACSPKIDISLAYIKSYFQNLGLQTKLMEFTNDCSAGPCKKEKGYNVIAIKRGTVRPNQFVLVGAHYDSINEDAVCGKAPGANDNGSGAAGVMELAKAFSGFKTEASIVFVAFGGEEEGLFGSTKLAKSMVSSKPFANLKASNMISFINLDMISYYDSWYGVIIEGSKATAPQRAAVKTLSNLVSTYTDLDVEISYEYADADHEPFLDRKMPGALLIEMDWGEYPGYHSAEDIMEYQDIPFAMEVLQATAAMMATGCKVIN